MIDHVRYGLQTLGADPLQGVIGCVPDFHVIALCAAVAEINEFEGWNRGISEWNVVVYDRLRKS